MDVEGQVRYGNERKIQVEESISKGMKTQGIYGGRGGPTLVHSNCKE